MAEPKYPYGLDDLLVQARKEGKWLHCPYQNIWLSPDDAEREWAMCHFVWGPVNWNLADPQQELNYRICQAEQAQKNVESFKALMGVK